ncbi:SusC/RagA family TonB-linked outer membrane protein [Emticicia sp. 17c]|uniref:SusC/RagA family TonB-linked outer membrane protein n=1 Tax=Emticicia sp. 17c TaxID=3127704 RepID=UPI00301B8AA5
MKKRLQTSKILLLAMKISAVQLVLAMIFVTVSYAYDSKAQEFLNKSVSLKAENQSLRMVLGMIEEQTEVKFVYSSKAIHANRKVNYTVSGQKLSEVLESLLKPMQVNYRIIGGQIILNWEDKQALIENIEPAEMLEKEAKEAVVDQPIKGKVTDKDGGGGLPGVSVTIKGTTRGVTTDANGEYSIVVPNDKSVLVYSFLGYEKQEVTVGNRTTIDIVLGSDMKSLDEVIVVGYGTQKKANLTGAVSSIDAAAIENRPASNLATAMQGMSPGLIITRTSGQPGSEDIGIQIRGATTANGSVSPLVVLDGVAVPSNTLQTMNPNDVESISVLKDAAAAAIYGAQAAGGVILVTTKKGKAGKITFDYLAQQGTDWAINVPGRMSLLEEAEFANLARANSGSGPEYNADDIQRIKDGIPYVVNPVDTSTYLFYNQVPLTDQILRKYSSMRTHNLTMRGGTDKLNFLISGGYYGKDGVFKVGPDSYDRYNLRINLGAQLTKFFSLDSRLSYTNDKTETSSAGINGQGLLYQIYRLRTRTPFFTPEGRYNGAGSAATAYASMEAGGFNDYRRNYFDGVFTLKAAEFVKGLNLRAVLGTQYRRGDREVFNRTVPLWGKSRILSYLNQVNSYNLTNELTTNTNLQLLANYDKQFAGKHNLGLFAGYQWEAFRFSSFYTAASNLVSNDLPTLNLGDDKTKSNSQNIYAYAYQSIFGRVNYNFDDRYLLEGTLRSDESSRLAPGFRVKVFPSASAGWNIHREAWFANQLRFISEFKLRASWGRLGGALGNTLGYYDYLNQLSRSASLVLGDSRTSYIYQSSIPSAQLSWETIETSNFGADFGFFQNKLQVSADYYVKYNRNMLTPQQLPAVIGIGTPRKNNGELKSWGWELEARYRGNIGQSFSYNIAANVSDNQNKLLNFSGRRVISAGTNSIIEGYPLNTIWGYQTAGYFTSTDEVKAWAFQDNRTGAGDVKYIDQNGDGKLTIGNGNIDNHGDLVLLGTTQPRYLFGVTLGFQWKNIDFSAFVQGVGKRSYRPNAENIAPLLVTWKQALAVHRDYWTPENPDALYPRPYVGGTHNYLPSDKWVLNASYARLKNIQVGYTLPVKWTSRINISRARFFFSGQDLLTVSALGKFKGLFDPENRDNVDNDYPFFATASVGLNLSF